ncbi:hypothetical protein ACFW3A_17435 [Streptomyces pilosus]|uniref:hypothetical protein n=1 Tax=Streptomyces pilosus TaxID=28893 RepID=UPI00369F137D
MSRWSSVIPGRGRRSGPGTGRRGPAGPAGGANGTGNRGVGGPPVEDVDGVLLVRSVEDDSFPLDVVAEVAGAVGREEDVVTVIVGSAAGGGGPGADHWARLGALLDSLRARGTERIRLVMSGAGDDRPDRPGVARRIADAWELEVTAPDGAVLITPGGTLFVHGDSRPGRAWWRFAPGAEPRKAGRRAPAPVWEEALDGVPERTAGGCVVDRVPAGVVIRPAEAPGPAPDDLCFSVPVDHERLTVLVGAPRAEDVAADEVAAVLAGLPQAERARTRLAPGGRRDLLRLGQSVADLLGTEVEVLTGLPLLDDHAPPGTPPRPTLVGLDGRPSWRPFVSSVVCGPVDSEGRAPVPRPAELHPPDWILGGGEPGTVRLTDRWQATVTRAGLALWTPDGPRPGPLGPAVDPEVCAVELGMPGQPLDDSLLPALSLLVRGLGSDVRSRTTLLVRGRLLAGDGGLRRLAAEHGIPGIRYVTAGRAARPRPATGRPGTATAPGRVPPSGRAADGPGGRTPPTVAHGPATPAAQPAAGAGRSVPPGASARGPGEGAGGPEAVEPGGVGRGRGAVVASSSAGVGAGVGRGADGTSGGPSAGGNGEALPAGGTGEASPAGGPGAAADPPAAGAGARAGGGPGAGEGGPGAGAPDGPGGTGGASPGAGVGRGVAEAAVGARAAGPGGAVQGSDASTALSAAGPGAGAVRRRPGAAGTRASVTGPGGGTVRPEGVTSADPQAAGPAAPVLPPAASPDTPQSHGPSAAGAVVSPDVRAGAEAPGGPAAGTGGAVPTPDSPAAGPGGAEAGASVPAASAEPGPPGRPAEGDAATTSPEPGDGVGSGRRVSAAGTAPDGRADAGAAGPRTVSPAGPRPGTTGERSGPEPDGGRAGRAGAGTGPRGPGGPAPAPGRAALPFLPGHVSGAAERAAFRDAAAGAWKGHAAAVSRVLTRMPALRGHELEAARTDLVAAHAFLTAAEGPLHHRELIRDLHTGEGRLLPYAGCLASALRRLPSYRGVALRGGDADGPEPAAGALLHDPAPVSALAGASALPAGSPVRYAIWSVTGRKVRQLLDRPDGATEEHEEIVFVPGTGFRVLGVRIASAGRPVVLLRELPGNATAYMDGSEELSGLDLKALAHLEEALAKGFRVGDGPQWPERCSGPVGADG